MGFREDVDLAGVRLDALGRLVRTAPLREPVGRLERTGALREVVGRRVVTRLGVLRDVTARLGVARVGVLIVVVGRREVTRLGALLVVAGRPVVARVGVVRRVVTGVCRVGVARRAVGVARVGVARRVVVAGLVVRLRGCCAAALVVLRAVADIARCAGAVLGLSTVRRPVLVVAIAPRCGVRPVTLFAASRLAAGDIRLAAEVLLTDEPRAPA